MKVLITAGPTREYLDDVRFLSNASSGRTGFALARHFSAAGDEVLLVSGPTSLDAPSECECVRVESTLEMEAEVLSRFEWCECLIMAAAVSDYRLAQRIAGKEKKSSAEKLIKLVPNPDILLKAGSRKGRQILVGFSLETDDLITRATEKLKRKNLDLIVANTPATLGSDRISCTILSKEGGRLDLREVSKEEFSRELAELIHGRASSSLNTKGAKS